MDNSKTDFLEERQKKQIEKALLNGQKKAESKLTSQKDKYYYEPFGNQFTIKIPKSELLLTSSETKAEDIDEVSVDAVGPDCRQVKKGNIVKIFPHARPMRIEIAGEPYVQFPENMIAGFVKKKDK